MKPYQKLDPLFEHRARLTIAVLLARHQRISFARFKEELQMTDGNLGAQLRKLEDAEYVSLQRDFVDRRPVTWYSLSAKGRKAIKDHLKALQDLISPP